MQKYVSFSNLPNFLSFFDNFFLFFDNFKTKLQQILRYNSSICWAISSAYFLKTFLFYNRVLWFFLLKSVSVFYNLSDSISKTTFKLGFGIVCRFECILLNAKHNSHKHFSYQFFRWIKPILPMFFLWNNDLTTLVDCEKKQTCTNRHIVGKTALAIYLLFIQQQSKPCQILVNCISDKQNRKTNPKHFEKTKI